MSQQNDFKYKFKKKSYEEWKQTASQQSLISTEVAKIEELKLSEHVQIELGKLSINSYLFKEYMDSLEPFLEVDEDGYLDLTETEIANIWKCLTALSASKKELLKSSISLEVH